jgi:hypothetical protein
MWACFCIAMSLMICHSAHASPQITPDQLPADSDYYNCDIHGRYIPDPNSKGAHSKQTIIISRSAKRIWLYQGVNSIQNLMPVGFSADSFFTIFEGRLENNKNLRKYVFDHNLKSIRIQEFSSKSGSMIFEWAGQCKPSTEAIPYVKYPSISEIDPRNIKPPLIGYVCKGFYHGDNDRTKILTMAYILKPLERSVYIYNGSLEKANGIWQFNSETVYGQHFTSFANGTIQQETLINTISGEFKIIFSDASRTPTSPNLKDNQINGSCKRSTNLLD